MRYSIVFLNYDPEGIKDWVNGTRLKVLECSKDKDYEFIEVKNVSGYVNAVNVGIAESLGEYVFILNDDIILSDNDWLEKMAIPNAITSWRKNPFYKNNEMMPDGACYCIHRSVIDNIGLFDTRYADGYGCDEIDYFYTAQEAGFELLEAPVKLTHMENKTYRSKYFAKDKEAMTERNANLFNEKWKQKFQ